MSESSTTKGILLAVLSCLLWGSVFIFARFLLGSPSKIDPYSLVFFRFSTASVMLLLYARYKKQPLLPSSWKQFYGMVKTGKKYLYLFSEGNATMRELLGFIGSMLVLNIISPNGLHLTGNPWGILCVFLSAVSWVIGGYHGKDLMRGGSRITAVAWCMLICALLDLPVLAVMHKSLIFPTAPSTWAAILGMAIFPTSIAFVAWGEAMARLPLWQLNLTQNLTPVFTLVGSYFILHEPLTAWNVLGIAIVLGGLSAAALKSKKTS